MIISRLIWLSLWKFYVFSTVYKFSNKLYVFLKKTAYFFWSNICYRKNNGSWHVWGTWMKKQWSMTCLRYLNEKTMVHDMSEVSWTIVFFIQVPQTCHGPLFFHSSTSDMSWTIVFSFKYRYLNDGEIYDYIFREFYNTHTFVHCLCTQLFLEWVACFIINKLFSLLCL
jgi:hypothetical protein